jgi:hypothetical protein
MRCLLAVAPLPALTACNGDAPGEWTAIVYADSADHSNWVATPRFQSLEMCRRAAKESIAALPDSAKADYACGFQCGPDPGSPDLKACKEVKA